MLLSRYYLPIIKENLNNKYIRSHAFMLRTGMIKQHVSGIYSWLPIGVKVINNITKIIKNAMNNIGAHEMIMPCIQPADIWVKTKRIESYGSEMLKILDRNNNLLLFGPTNEDLITDIIKNSLISYKNLPQNFYQIQWKFRDEIRPRFGVIRSREFLMKDAYSFDIYEDRSIDVYNLMYGTYLKIFKSLGVSVLPVLANSGAIGGIVSHEFHIKTKCGDSTIYYDYSLENILNSINDYGLTTIKEIQNVYSVTEEKHIKSEKQNLNISKSIEVGHIFHIGTKYSELMNAYIYDNKSNLVPLIMSSYGIGISRLVGAIIESNSDEKGIIWSNQLTPFSLILINLNIRDSVCNEKSTSIYQVLKNSLGIEILYDDRDERPGNKFKTADLIGIPWQIIVGPKKIKFGIIELKNRVNGIIEEISYENLFNKIQDIINVK